MALPNNPPAPAHTKGKKNLIKSIDYINVLHSLGYDFRQNITNDRVEVNGEPLSDSLEAVIFSKLRDEGYLMVNVARDAFTAEAYYNQYHPIRDFFAGLKYDGGQHIAELASYFDNADGTFKTWLRRWLIGAVRRAMEPGVQNRVLVLDGPQNCGKSNFVKWLVPESLQTKHYKSGPIYPDNKDCLIALCERWVWEVAELGATTRRADREALKAFISLESATFRPPYGRYEITKPALSSFIGTVNNVNGILSDPTGYRRFMFSKIKGIDWKGYLANVDVNAVWAEALEAYKLGEPADLLPDEVLIAEGINKTYEVEMPLEGIMLQYFEINPTESTWWTFTNEIIAAVENPGDDPITKLPRAGYRGNTANLGNDISTVMKALGCVSDRRKPVPGRNSLAGYIGIRRLP